MVMGEPERIDSVEQASERVGAGRPHAHPSPAAYAHVSTLSSSSPPGRLHRRAFRSPWQCRVKPRALSPPNASPHCGWSFNSEQEPHTGVGWDQSCSGSGRGSGSDQVLRSRSATAFYGPTRNCRAQAPELSWARRCGTSALWMQRAQAVALAGSGGIRVGSLRARPGSSRSPASHP